MTAEQLDRCPECRGVQSHKMDCSRRRVARCEEYARRGTGYGVCDRLLDARGQCDRASDHVEAP